MPPLWRETGAAREAAVLFQSSVWRGAGVAPGEDRPVLLIPGFLAGDGSLSTMTRWRRAGGYHTHRAGIRANVSCSEYACDRLEKRLEGFAEATGQRVAIIGQSRGGTFARALAVRRPELVSGIVTLGSPLRDQLAVHPLVRLNVGLVGALGTFGLRGMFSLDCLRGRCCQELRAHVHDPLPDDVGFVSIYSKSDGVVRWQSCLDEDAEHAEVDSSHCGMAVHRDVFRVVAEVLADF